MIHSPISQLFTPLFHTDSFCIFHNEKFRFCSAALVLLPMSLKVVSSYHENQNVGSIYVIFHKIKFQQLQEKQQQLQLSQLEWP